MKESDWKAFYESFSANENLTDNQIYLGFEFDWTDESTGLTQTKWYYFNEAQVRNVAQQVNGGWGIMRCDLLKASHFIDLSCFIAIKNTTTGTNYLVKVTPDM